MDYLSFAHCRSPIKATSWTQKNARGLGSSAEHADEERSKFNRI